MTTHIRTPERTSAPARNRAVTPLLFMLWREAKLAAIRTGVAL
jgi:hypothetical protein